MSIESQTKSGGDWSVKATGRDTQALAGMLDDVAGEDRELRLQNDHPLDKTPGVEMLFRPPDNFVGFLPDGRCVYGKPWGRAEFEKVEGGWAVLPRV